MGLAGPQAGIVLQALCHNDWITSLDLSSNRLADEHLTELALAVPTMPLALLDLSSNVFTQIGCDALLSKASWREPCKLEVLRLNFNELAEMRSYPLTRPVILGLCGGDWYLASKW